MNLISREGGKISRNNNKTSYLNSRSMLNYSSTTTKHNALTSMKNSSLIYKVDDEPSSAEYNIIGQFDRLQEQLDKLNKIKKHKIALKNVSIQFSSIENAD